MAKYSFTAYGGAREVGRSMFELKKDEKSVFLDAGVKLGKEIEFPLVDGASDILITHSHLDHVGYLPLIKKLKNVFLTKPTRDLADIMIADFKRISKIEQLNDYRKAIKLLEYNNPFSLNGFNITAFEAGHILGSAMFLIDNILYTGDFNVRKTKLLNPARPVKADVLIIESTYGGKDDIIVPYKESIKKLVEIIKEAYSKQGVVLIPSFAVGRAQEILLILDSLIRSGILPKIDIYIDGMIKKALRIYRTNVIYCRKEIQNQILTSLYDPFFSPFFKVPRKKDRSDIKKPAVIVTTSGMLVGGPILTYLKMFAEDENAFLVFVGYQAEGTLGRKILDGERRIIIGDKEYNLNMKIEYIHLSAHSDRNDLLRFIASVKPSKVIIVHGEDKKAEELADAIKADVIIPKLNETISF